MKTIVWTSCWLLAVAVGVASVGCGNVDVRVPKRIQIGNGGNDKNGVSQIPRGDPNDQSALAKENRQLREYIANLDDELKKVKKQRSKDADRVEDLQEKIEDLENDLKKAKKQRDEYKEQRDEYKKQRDRYKDALDD